MLRYPLIHPPLLEVLAGAGHGSRILIADANYAHRTNSHARARVIHLNLRPGLVTVEQVLEVVSSAVPIEAAAMMEPDDGTAVTLEADYRKHLERQTPLRMLGRQAFYAACLDPALDATVATGDQRHFANILLTIGALPARNGEAG
ncbi:RbsD/FucU domain-containing protein [Catenulispora yoronensis]|uniref:RbsD/FucU domain-containing protein n=1 Tax=Catenulispora yoronensis TaxID=450799 RepID=A0ABN2V4K7_9ACTN